MVQNEPEVIYTDLNGVSLLNHLGLAAMAKYRFNFILIFKMLWFILLHVGELNYIISPFKKYIHDKECHSMLLVSSYISSLQELESTGAT